MIFGFLKYREPESDLMDSHGKGLEELHKRPLYKGPNQEWEAKGLLNRTKGRNQATTTRQMSCPTLWKAQIFLALICEFPRAQMVINFSKNSKYCAATCPLCVYLGIQAPALWVAEAAMMSLPRMHAGVPTRTLIQKLRIRLLLEIRESEVSTVE